MSTDERIDYFRSEMVGRITQLTTDTIARERLLELKILDLEQKLAVVLRELHNLKLSV